jgi:hypothetical protein
MKFSPLVPVAGIVLALGASAYAATIAVDSGRSDSRSSVTPPIQKPLKPPTIKTGSFVSGMARGWIRLTVRAHGAKHGTSIRIKLTASTLFFKVGVGRIARSDIHSGDRITVKWRTTSKGFVASRVTVIGRAIRA